MRTSGPVVRPGRTADLDEVVAIYNHYVEHTAATFDVTPLRADERRAWLDEHTRGGRHRIVVATEENDAVIGWATSSAFRPRPAYSTTVEASVYCRPDQTGRGLGSHLYRSLFDALASEDIARIVAGMTLPNPASVALHRRFGFVHVGTFTHVGRKFGRYWDVGWFERPLTIEPSQRPDVIRPPPSSSLPLIPPPSGPRHTS